MKKIVILLCSEGENKKLAQKLAEEITSQNEEHDIISLANLELPLYTTEEEKKAIPQAAKDLSSSLQKCRAMIVVAPEYNGGIPPVLNNAIAWVSRSGDDWREAFNGKMALVATHSGGGGLHALMSMRQQLSYIGVNVLGRQIHTHYKKPLNLESAKACIAQLLELTAS